LLTPKILGSVPYLLQRKISRRARVITLGVKARFRGKGLESVMLHEALKVSYGLGFTETEASWILEDNVKMRRLLEAFGGTVNKTYRIYERTL
jgi:hypothetical protein